MPIVDSPFPSVRWLNIEVRYTEVANAGATIAPETGEVTFEQAVAALRRLYGQRDTPDIALSAEAHARLAAALANPAEPSDELRQVLRDDTVERARDNLIRVINYLPGGEAPYIDALIDTIAKRAERAETAYKSLMDTTTSVNAALRAKVERWKDYASHLEWCRTCAEDGIEACLSGRELRGEAAR